MSREAYFNCLKAFSELEQTLGGDTQERNFLPFIAWLNKSAPVETFPAEDEIETVGINTVGDAQRLLDYWNK